MSIIHMDDMILPDHVVLTLMPAHPAWLTESLSVDVITFSSLGLIWHDVKAHPNARTFTPWSRVKSLDW